jgi:hypothetical protein
MQYLRTLSDVASARSVAVTRGSFLASAHQDLSLTLVQSQGYAYRYCALLLSKASGLQNLPGSDTPFLDVSFFCSCGAYLVVSYSCFPCRLVLCQWLSGPCACFPALVVIVFAFRPLVECNGCLLQRILSMTISYPQVCTALSFTLGYTSSGCHARLLITFLSICIYQRSPPLNCSGHFICCPYSLPTLKHT